MKHSQPCDCDNKDWIIIKINSTSLGWILSIILVCGIIFGIGYLIYDIGYDEGIMEGHDNLLKWSIKTVRESGYITFCDKYEDGKDCEDLEIKHSCYDGIFSVNPNLINNQLKVYNKNE